MIETIELLSALGDGLITRSALRSAGLSSERIVQCLQRGLLRRVRPGVYVSGPLWAALWPEQQHRLLVRATLLLAEREWVVSHLSAAAMHGLGTIGGWPSTVHVSDPEARGGASSAHITVHRGAPGPDTVLIDGILVTSLPRTLADVAASEPLSRAVPAIDAGLRMVRESAGTSGAAQGLAWRSAEMGSAQSVAEEGMRDHVHAELERAAPRRGYRQAELAIAFASGLAGSVGESLTRVRFHEHGFEIPELQVTLARSDAGEADLDFLWRGIRKAGEYDGKFKYTRGAIVKPGQDPGEIVFSEKRREDALRPQLNSMTRWVWDVVFPPLAFLRFTREAGVPLASPVRGRRGESTRSRFVVG
ncbi:type IV toxin-antitoxin system AbiEi family antitoxin domain-containing protein [Microterricola viridarii]|uniref:AbiEi antitoxin N-terminal domain-containing protein n=1 Tax=Microterricola viridarii TaxID=412690 RepID=A0A120I0M1_9MICO|nr:type IV toxin-antitoxin system AbiEi family antitoxin domain-containing protein [Microterricola viridarii]AMB59552.1 hypothetical protein AWU67_12520 [Microterricola viridarii]